MSGLTMILIYLVAAVVIALASRRVPWLRRKMGWVPLGEPAGRDSIEAVSAAVLASVGTGYAAATEGRWRVFRPSLGLRLLTPALTVALVVYWFNPGLYDMEKQTLPLEVLLLMLGVAAYSNLYVFRYSAATNGSVLRLRSAVWPERRYALDGLVGVEDDGVHSYRLTFRDGRAVEILKAVEGAAQLRHMLAETLERNTRG